MSPIMRLLPALCVLVFGVSLTARAQDLPATGELPAFRTNNVLVVPAMIGSAGHDSNIHREGPPAGPIPSAEFFGAGAVSLAAITSALELNATSGAEIVSFRHHPGEGGLSWAHGGTVRLPFARLRPKGTFRYADTYARPTGFEIGERSRHQELTFGAGLDVRVSARATTAGEVNHLSTNYAADAKYQGSSLYETLSLDLLVAAGRFSYDVSPLTTITVVASQDRSRFRRAPSRDTNGGLVAAGFTMSRPALISGSAQIGLRRFEPLGETADTFTGLTGNANLLYMRPTGLSVGVGVTRDTQFSYSETLAYYVFTEVGVRVTHTPGAWRIGAGSGYRWLDYRYAGTIEGLGRVDHLVSASGMLAHEVGRGMEIGVNGNHMKKSGVLAFSGTRVMVFWSLGSSFLMRFDRPLPGEMP